jgi:endonuclease/exonuclease/phosphatase (EEP) superfamily protein YafD
MNGLLGIVALSAAWATALTTLLLIISSYTGWFTNLITVLGHALGHRAMWLVAPAAVLAWGTNQLVLLVLSIACLAVVIADSARLGTDRPPPAWAIAAPTVTVLSANVLFTNTRYQDIAQWLLDADTDIVALTEVTNRAVIEFERAGIFERYPYRNVRAVRWSASGSAIFSKLPFETDSRADRSAHEMPTVRVSVGGRPLELIDVHLTAPGRPRHIARWQTELRELGALARSSTTALALIGDFNTSSWHYGFRQLLRVGLTDAHAARGRGLVASYPASPIGLMRIDHAVVNDKVAATQLRDVTIPGSDHTGFIITLAVDL